MNLFDLLACPTCKVAVIRQGETCVCSHCAKIYPIIDGVPVLFPDGSVPDVQHEAELGAWREYAPWIHRVVLESLPPSAVALDLGSGNVDLDLPNVIRMDAALTPYVDVVGDAHALPFLPGVFDFIFSLAVIEHLRQPFIAAQEMYRSLRPGGYVYGECNFVYPYHGYPHHYFNASIHGLEQVFAPFALLRSGIAPYQMPSFALRTVLRVYLRDLYEAEVPGIKQAEAAINRLSSLPLTEYDGCLSERQALNTAAGVFFFGVKGAFDSSEVVPHVVRAAWEQSLDLQQRFPHPLDVGHAENLMRWARDEGCRQVEGIKEYFSQQPAFRKRNKVNEQDLALFMSWPLVEPRFGRAEGYDPPPLPSEEEIHSYVLSLEAQVRMKNEHIQQLEAHIARLKAGRVMRLLQLVKRP